MIKLTDKKKKIAFRKALAIKLLLVILFQVGFPTYTFALSGGPSQPEVESFSPVGTSDMVDVFSGDFSYNIPLLDVDGYPINIAYKSGITTDQEASWVGLGWNVNPGVINRNMRGIPDDFKGDQIIHKINMKANQTFGLTVGVGDELFGFKLIGIGYSVGVKYNTYNGISVEQSLDISISSGKGGKGPLSGDLGITSSSDNGLSINPSISFSSKVKKGPAKDATLGAKIGASFSARGGLSKLTLSASASKETTNKKKTKSSNDKIHASSSFNVGMPTFSPMVNHDMHNFSIAGNFRFGVSLFGTHTTASIDGYYSTQHLSSKIRANSAYGYLHSEAGQADDNAIMDFNRENDGNYLKTTPALPTTNYTYDIYSISGQGAGGSYRASRNDIGYVYDPRYETVSDGGSLQIELGAGELFHGGFQIGVTYATNKSGRWSTDNKAADRLKFGNNTQGALSETYAFREANEKSVEVDPSYISSSGDFDPVMAKLNQQSKFDIIADNSFVKSNGTTVAFNGPVVRHSRQKRDDVMTTLTRAELKNGLGIERAHPSSYNSQPHHIAEITNLGEDGKRYVYGVAAYNTTQEEITFAVGKGLTGGNPNSVDYSAGLVAYNAGTDDSESNSLGIDNYYSNTIMPAYAHSYLLSSILSADYVDIDTVRGPSDADLGTYVKFYNTKYNGNYQWRTPISGSNQVNFNEGLKTDPSDDKGNFVYGAKELWYLDSIVTKNYIAIFHTSSRADGHGALKNGSIDNTSEMRKLDGISLYSKADYRANHANAIPLKEVHFVYDYTLCPGVTNNNDATTAGGKLTLKQIYFTYQNSNKAKFSSYQFEYNGLNPNYDFKAYDRWGNYKPNTGADYTPTGLGTTIPTTEFPYVEQNKTTADSYSSAWHLTDISIPSGGSIHVCYESDDYAYVQNKPAMQMCKILGTDEGSSSNVQSVSDPTKFNRDIFVEADPNYTNANDYISGINLMYFRCLMQFDPLVATEYDYVPGYANISGATYISNYNSTGKPAIQLTLKPVSMRDIGAESYNPITKAACQFGRLNLSRYIWNAPGIDPNASFGVSVLNALVNADFTKNITQALEGPNNAIWDSDKAHRLVTGRSWVRLNNPGHRKFGGGVRVKTLKMNDAWDGMTNNAEKPFSYGQEYDYKLNNGTSSGVASYEPQIGGDENPWKQPVFYDIKHVLAPDDEHYLEEPFGECFFPSPSVGYSRVTVKNLQYAYVNNHATGKVVHEFYTAKDYPTITSRTAAVPMPEKTSPFSLSSLFKIETREYMTTTQGFYVELNDMHGKPSKQSVYQQNNDTAAISSVEYVYQSDNYLAGNFRLNNQATVIDPKGNTSQADIGVFYDMIGDMRESKDESYALNWNPNIDNFFIIIDITIPMILPSFSNEKTQFRSAVYTKKVERFGLLQKTIAKDLGSTVTTENLAYDSETGQVLLTQTQNDYNDPEYSFTMPAHWYYDGMGQAYKNIGSNYIVLNLDGTGTAPLTNADQYFVPGDEVGIYSGAVKKGWVLSVTPTSVTLADKQGVAITGANKSVKVIRSGRRDLSTTPIQTVTTLTNPLNTIKSNVFANVLQTSAVEYVEGWRTACDCFNDDLVLPSTNPYVLGTKGFWKQIRSHTFLTDRIKHNYDNNTDLRVDGVFNAYTPFYALNGNTWTIDDRNWTFVSEVTEYSPFTQELENRDALGRYSAATFGYNQTLATSVGANTKYRELGVDNFEDYNFSVCADNHFRFSQSTLSVSNAQSHTGKNSIKVSPGNAATITKQLVPDCEPSGCNLQIGTSTAAGVTTVSTTNGTAPYTMDYDILSGNPSITFPGGVMTITGAPYKISLTVVDKNGCNAIKTISQTISN
jgi:hypothetical protein